MSDTSRLKRELQPMPDDVRLELEQRDLRDAYNARPAYQRSDYLPWIARGRHEATRTKRLAQMFDELGRGVGPRSRDRAYGYHDCACRFNLHVVSSRALTHGLTGDAAVFAHFAEAHAVPVNRLRIFALSIRPDCASLKKEVQRSVVLLFQPCAHNKKGRPRRAAR